MRPLESNQRLEARRRQALHLLKKQTNLSAVARQVGVHRSSVLRWRDTFRRKGWEGLRSRPNTGRPPLLNPTQKRRLAKVLLQGPLSWGYSTDLWTLKRIAQVIARKFHVSYHPCHTWRLLQGMGWSCQKPEKRARERNEKAIAHWKRVVWPHIKKLQKTWTPSGFHG